MSDIPKLQALPPFTFPISPDELKRLLHDICSDIGSLWTDAGTPEIVNGRAAHTLILRLNALPIQCAKVRYQRAVIPTWCDVGIDFVGDASTLPLYVAFISALASELPDGQSAPYQSAQDERERLRYYAALYAKLLPPPTAEPMATASKAEPKKRHRISAKTVGGLERLRQLREDCIRDNKELPDWTKACKAVEFNPDTASKHAFDLQRDWTDRKKHFKRYWYDSEFS